MKKILIVEPLLEDSISAYKQKWASASPNNSYVIDYMPDIKQEDISKVICSDNYCALIVRNKVIDRNIMQSWINSKLNHNLLIVRAGSNISTIDVDAAKELGITVKNTPGANSAAVAQHIISQILMLSQSFSSAIQANNDVNNNIQKCKSLYASHTLSGDILALIGTGYIGSKVSKMANSLGMHVKAYSPELNEERAKSIGATYCNTISEAVAGANFISIQTPFTLENSKNYPKTFSMINSEVLNLAADGAKLISVSRRDVINMDDLEKALQQGKISNISLDLLLSEIKELKTSNPAIFKNNIITPLIACESHKADLEIANQSLKKVEEFFS